MKVYILAGIISFFFCTIRAQPERIDAKIIFSGKLIKLSEPLTISVVLTDSEKRPSIAFPDIDGLEKRSTSATSSYQTVDGVKLVVQKISQEYYASKAGRYVIPSFDLQVLGTRLHSGETSVTFSENENAAGVVMPDKLLPADERAGDQVFFAIRADKSSVYIREGFSLGISLYIAEDAPIEMEFYQFNEQLQAILAKVRPLGCWEENTGIEEIVKRRVKIRQRNYNEYQMYRAHFFPLKLENIRIPSVALSMLVVDRQGTVNTEKKIIEKFYSKAFNIEVKPLPPHPLRDQVAVGEYQLREQLSSEEVFPGESVRYQFKIVGKGNIVGIPAPDILPNAAFDFYPPELSQVVSRTAQTVSGEKGFEYFVVPRKDGTFPFSRYFQWVYFDTRAARYDTLRSSKIVQVKGEDYSLGNLSLGSSNGLYDSIESRDSSQTFINYSQIVKILSNLVVILLLVVMVWVFRK
ncbi:BatD family protein [Dyadobacter tibetensis]|uniref:BatD family protein n=1 Tax=Dyadobacter tibetensis TaxID=1211851 RepID=UPI0004717F62|nr:BatD family protein [Dyadobacter tibetensis]